MILCLGSRHRLVKKLLKVLFGFCYLHEFGGVVSKQLHRINIANCRVIMREVMWDKDNDAQIVANAMFFIVWRLVTKSSRLKSNRSSESSTMTENLLSNTSSVCTMTTIHSVLDKGTMTDIHGTKLPDSKLRALESVFQTIVSNRQKDILLRRSLLYWSTHSTKHRLQKTSDHLNRLNEHNLKVRREQGNRRLKVISQRVAWMRYKISKTAFRRWKRFTEFFVSDILEIIDERRKVLNRMLLGRMFSLWNKSVEEFKSIMNQINRTERTLDKIILTRYFDYWNMACRNMCFIEGLSQTSIRKRKTSALQLAFGSWLDYKTSRLRNARLVGMMCSTRHSQLKLKLVHSWIQYTNAKRQSKLNRDIIRGRHYLLRWKSVAKNQLRMENDILLRLWSLPAFWGRYRTDSNMLNNILLAIRETENSSHKSVNSISNLLRHNSRIITSKAFETWTLQTVSTRKYYTTALQVFQKQKMLSKRALALLRSFQAWNEKVKVKQTVEYLLWRKQRIKTTTLLYKCSIAGWKELMNKKRIVSKLKVRRHLRMLSKSFHSWLDMTALKAEEKDKRRLTLAEHNTHLIEMQLRYENTISVLLTERDDAIENLRCVVKSIGNLDWKVQSSAGIKLSQLEKTEVDVTMSNQGGYQGANAFWLSPSTAKSKKKTTSDTKMSKRLDFNMIHRNWQ